jgi:hypothetical protein
MRRHSVLLVAFVLACSSAGGPAGTPPAASGGNADFPGLGLVREEDIRRDLFALAGDAMRGREAGTIDELRASGWVAERAREAGLEPAGEDGTYFQWFPLRRTRQSATSKISVDGQTLALWRDVTLQGISEADIDAPIVWLGDSGSLDTANVQVSGKVAALVLNSQAAPRAADALAARRWIGQAPQRVARPLLARGAVAVLLVADPGADVLFDLGATNSMRGRYALDGAAPTGQGQRRGGQAQGQTPILFVRHSWLSRLSSAGRLQARLTVDDFVYPSVNIVARVRGTDPALRDEYVLFSAHQDHDGVRASIAGDSIWNGADDNATVAVAVLAIGRAFAQRPGRRSALFVWHGAEEKGLFGSRWHAARPVVPRDKIVAVLNGDMIGRNHPDTAALMGTIPPHRNSTDLVRMAHEANHRVIHFAIDSTWDRPTHPEGWYFRSDHLPYARENIPALFYSSNLHPDYHTPRDNPEAIDVTKLTRIARWMYATGWLVANGNQRPGLDPGFRLER